MAIWEFTEHSDEHLEQIFEHCEALRGLGIEQDKDMMTKLRLEISSRWKRVLAKKEDQ